MALTMSQIANLIRGREISSQCSLNEKIDAAFESNGINVTDE